MDGTRGRGGAGAGGWSPFEKTADEHSSLTVLATQSVPSPKPARAVS